jgi:hypothetical protein
MDVEEKYINDFRPRIGDENHQKEMEKGYNHYKWRHNLSLSEITGALFHPNSVIRKFKQMGYISMTRYHLYKILRKFKLTDI